MNDGVDSGTSVPALLQVGYIQGLDFVPDGLIQTVDPPVREAKAKSG